METKGISFLIGNDTISSPGSDRIRFEPLDAGDKQIVAAYHTKGIYEKWLAAIKDVKDFARVMAFLYAAFCAVCLRIFECDNFGVDIHGRTSTGKTTTLVIAGSVWGCPVIGSPTSCIASWDVTRVGAERRAATTSDLPILLDDTKRGDPRVIGDILYSLHQGRGRGRGTPSGAAETRSWRTVLLSTGEARATSYTNNAGVRSRILEICGNPFDYDDEGTRELVNSVHRIVSQNYGHAGRMFVEWLIKNHERWPDFKQRYQEQCSKYDVVDGVSMRLADAATAIATTGMLVHEAGILPWEFVDPFIELWPPILAECGTAHAHIRGLHALYNWCVAHQANFHGQRPADDTDSREPAQGWYGAWDDDDDFIGIIPERLKQVLHDEGFDAEAVISEWHEHGWIKQDGCKNTLRKWINGKRVRVVALRTEVIERELNLT